MYLQRFSSIRKLHQIANRACNFTPNRLWNILQNRVQQLNFPYHFHCIKTISSPLASVPARLANPWVTALASFSQPPTSRTLPPCRPIGVSGIGSCNVFLDLYHACGGDFLIIRRNSFGLGESLTSFCSVGRVV